LTKRLVAAQIRRMTQTDPLIRALRIRMLDANLKPAPLLREAGVSRAAWWRWCNGGDFTMAAFRRVEAAVDRLTGAPAGGTDASPGTTAICPSEGGAGAAGGVTLPPPSPDAAGQGGSR
jgi:hypothetical protein